MTTIALILVDFSCGFFFWIIISIVDLETSGDKTYLIHNDGLISTIVAKFTDTSDFTNINKDSDIKVAGDL